MMPSSEIEINMEKHYNSIIDIEKLVNLALSFKFKYKIGRTKNQ